MRSADSIGLQDLKIERVASEVHEGLQFMHKRSAAANQDPSMDWQSDQAGQVGCTLISLALTLVVCYILESCVV